MPSPREKALLNVACAVRFITAEGGRLEKES